MYLPKVVNTVLVTEVKKFFAGLQYKWSILKGEASTSIFVDTKWIQCKWNETMQLGMDFLKPVKISELVAPIVGYVYAKFPEMEKEIREILKELDKKLFLTEGAIKVFKNQWQNHRFTIEYAENKLTILQEYGENYCKFTIDEELLCEILKLAAEDKDDKEPLQDFLYSILPTSMQDIIMKRMKEDFEEIYEFKVHDELEEKFNDSKNVKIDYDFDCKDDALIVYMNNEKKYRFVIKSHDKCIVEMNGKEIALCHNMTEVIEVIQSL